jgi:hypothetical protein
MLKTLWIVGPSSNWNVLTLVPDSAPLGGAAKTTFERSSETATSEQLAKRENMIEL